MKRYLRIYKAFLKNSVMAESQYRGNFFLLILLNFGWALVYIFLYTFIFKNIDQVGDWTYERSLVLAATFLLITALTSFLFKQNLSRIAQLVYYGGLDLILTKPLSSQFYVSLRQFYLRPFLRFIFGWLVLFTVLFKTNIQINFLLFFSYLFMMLIAVLVGYSLWFMSCCLVFWLGNVENIHEGFYAVLRITALPFDLFPGVLKEFVFFVVPLVFVSTIPAKTLLGLVSLPAVLYGVFIALFLLYLSHALWNYALTTYSSASS